MSTTARGALLAAMIASTSACSQHLVRTPDGWQPPDRPYRLLALDPSGNLMDAGWQLVSHMPKGNLLVRAEDEDDVDFRFQRGNGTLVVRTIPIQKEHRRYAPRYFAEFLRVRLCTIEDSGLRVTPVGMAWAEESIYLGYTTLKAESFEVGGRPAFSMVIDRAGTGPYSERRFFIAALHAPDEPSSVVVTYGAPRDAFDSGLAAAQDLVARIR